jgi:hypothetical protein
MDILNFVLGAVSLAMSAFTMTNRLLPSVFGLLLLGLAILTGWFPVAEMFRVHKRLSVVFAIGMTFLSIMGTTAGIVSSSTSDSMDYALVVLAVVAGIAGSVAVKLLPKDKGD